MHEHETHTVYGVGVCTLFTVQCTHTSQLINFKILVKLFTLYKHKIAQMSSLQSTVLWFLLSRQALLDGDVQCVPLITGTCSDEGLLNMSHILKEPIRQTLEHLGRLYNSRVDFRTVGQTLEHSCRLLNSHVDFITLRQTLEQSDRLYNSQVDFRTSRQTLEQSGRLYNIKVDFRTVRQTLEQ